MSRFVHIPRPTEAAALGRVGEPVLPPLARVLDLVIVARATHDQFGARHFASMLARHPEVNR